MKIKDALLLAGAALLLVVATYLGFRLGKGRQHPARESRVTEAPAAALIDGPTVSADLYFPGPGGMLFGEQRELPIVEDQLAQIELVLTTLLEGPVSEDLYPALPPEVAIGWVHLSPEAILYVDLQYTGEQSYPPWGSRQETLAIFSLVNTVLANAPEVESVVVLRNGQQQSTFAGHLDTSRPLVADSKLVARP